MKKQKWQFILLAVLLIACIGGYFLIKNAEFSDKDTAEETVLTDFDKEEVKELVVSGDHELDFVKEDDEWHLASLPDQALSQSSVTYPISQIANIKTDETVLEAVDDLSEYGLDDPLRTIQVTLNDGTVIAYHAGNRNNLLSCYYIQMEGDPNVYLVSDYYVTMFDKEPEDFFEEETETETETETVEPEESVSEETVTGSETQDEDAVETVTETELSETETETEAE